LTSLGILWIEGGSGHLRTPLMSIGVGTAKLCPKQLNKKLALIVISGGILGKFGPISPLLFNARKCSILGMGLFRKNGSSNEWTIIK